MAKASASKKEAPKGHQNSIAYQQLKNELFKDELAYYDEQFEHLCNQFGNDLLPTELTQIRKAIILEIEMSRISKQMKTVLENVEIAEKQIGGIKRQYLNLADLPDGIQARLSELQNTINSAYTAKKSLTTEKMDLEAKHQKLMIDLKATRDQRFSKIESNKKGFIDLIRMLYDKEVREREGRQIAQMTAAAEKELSRLSKPHQYADGTIDLPILDADTIEAEEKSDD